MSAFDSKDYLDINLRISAGHDWWYITPSGFYSIGDSYVRIMTPLRGYFCACYVCYNDVTPSGFDSSGVRYFTIISPLRVTSVLVVFVTIMLPLRGSIVVVLVILQLLHPFGFFYCNI